MAGHRGNKNQVKMKPHQHIVDIARAFFKEKKPKQKTNHTQDKCMFSSWLNTDGKPQMPLSGCGTQRHVSLGVDISECPPVLRQTCHAPSEVTRPEHAQPHSQNTGQNSQAQLSPQARSPTGERSQLSPHQGEPLLAAGSGAVPSTPGVGGRRDASSSGGNRGFPDPPNLLPAPRRASNTLS